MPLVKANRRGSLGGFAPVLYVVNVLTPSTTETKVSPTSRLAQMIDAILYLSKRKEAVG
ncbi:MAG: hypothetical protein H0X14_09460 [Acidobacteria bacterium]|nr:hypothetical protein [Acidobacteriota bacterium]